MITMLAATLSTALLTISPVSAEEFIKPAFEIQSVTVNHIIEKNISSQPEQEYYILEKDEKTPIDEIIKKMPKAGKNLFDSSFKKYFLDVCSEYDLDPCLMIAVMEKESGYHPDAINKYGTCFGLYQISLKWHSGRMEKLECDDLYDPYQNTLVAADFLAELIDTSRDLTEALMYYNMKRSTAKELYEKGEYSEYALSIQKRAEDLRKMYTESP